MTRIIEDNEAHYETHEVPFGRIYEWHPEHIILERDCDESSYPKGSSWRYNDITSGNTNDV